MSEQKSTKWGNDPFPTVMAVAMDKGLKDCHATVSCMLANENDTYGELMMHAASAAASLAIFVSNDKQQFEAFIDSIQMALTIWKDAMPEMIEKGMLRRPPGWRP